MNKTLWLFVCEVVLFFLGYQFRKVVEEKSKLGIVMILFWAIFGAGFSIISTALGLDI